MVLRTLREQFESTFGGAPAGFVRAPGRVNLIGEHTDYNDGFVLPMAIDQSTTVAFRPRVDRRVVLSSVTFGDRAEFELDALEKGPSHWVEYVKGVAWALQNGGHELNGWEGVVTGDVPIGAGLSSSASLLLAAARATSVSSGIPWDPVAMAQVALQAENGWVGLNCGIMDQMICACGEKGHALLIDCRSLDTRQVAMPPGVTVVILDTGTRRKLVDSSYNERRRECEEAAAILGVPALRDASLSDLDRALTPMPETAGKRARHVIGENERTLAAEKALNSGDAGSMGRLMDESHRSLREDYNVSSEALDIMVEVAHAEAGCLGARMTGAGFGGCAVALVEDPEIEKWIFAVEKEYQLRSGHTPALYACRPSRGAHEVEPAFSPG
jgi:galactokinase